MRFTETNGAFGWMMNKKNVTLCMPIGIVCNECARTPFIMAIKLLFDDVFAIYFH